MSVDIFKKIKIPERPIPILDSSIPIESYYPIDLSLTNSDLRHVNISNSDVCQEYITTLLKKQDAKVAFGGYLEQRNLYANSGRFQGVEARNIHLGLDFWSETGTKVLSPLKGVVHSFANNSDHGDYGPTIILEHELEDVKFFTLYGHLALDSLDGLYLGKKFDKGSVIARLGAPEINVGYAPHLHFQIILDLGEFLGDYPGVCSQSDLKYYRNNCPNPNLLLGIETSNR